MKKTFLNIKHVNKWNNANSCTCYVITELITHTLCSWHIPYPPILHILPLAFCIIISQPNDLYNKFFFTDLCKQFSNDLYNNFLLHTDLWKKYCFVWANLVICLWYLLESWFLVGIMSFWLCNLCPFPVDFFYVTI